MAIDNWGVNLSFEAGADLSAGQYKFVEITTAGTVTICNAITDNPIGVLQNKPTSGRTAEVRVLGVTKCQADGVVDEGDLIGTSADGQALVPAAGNFRVGRALSPAAAAAEIFTLLLIPIADRL